MAGFQARVSPGHGLTPKGPDVSEVPNTGG
jgi:hypothetical protein